MASRHGSEMLHFQKVLHPLVPPAPHLDARGYYGVKLSPVNQELFQHAFVASLSDSGLFSHSEVPHILDNINRERKHLSACAIEVTAHDSRLTPPTQSTTAYVIAHKDALGDAIDFIRRHFSGDMPEYNRPPNVAWHSLREEKSHSTPRGWLDPATQNLYFHDKTMFEETCRSLNITRFEDRTTPTTKIQDIELARKPARSHEL